MLTQIETFDLTQILQPVQEPWKATRDAIVFGPNQTIVKGQAVGIKTADQKGYGLVSGASDGTQNFVGFSIYSFLTDANSRVFYGPNAVSGARIGPWTTSPIFKTGIFDPQDLQSRTVTAAQVDTDTPANIATGNTFTLTATEPDGSTVALTYTAVGGDTAANVVTGLTALINAATDATFNSVTPSGTTTLILTGKKAGLAFTITPSATGGTATFTRAATTAAAGLSIADIATGGVQIARLLHNGFWYLP